MSDSQSTPAKRTWIITSACAGAVGGVATAVPFVSSFQLAKAAGAAVEVDISALKEGEKLTVEWRDTFSVDHQAHTRAAQGVADSGR